MRQDRLFGSQLSVLAKNFLMLENTSSAARSTWNAERSALVADVLRRTGRSGTRLLVRGQVHGESMLPALWPGDVVEIESCSPEEVRPGEIVLALRDSRLVTHRLVTWCKPNGFLLRGDSVPRPDPLLPPEALLGRLVRVAEAGSGSSTQTSVAAGFRFQATKSAGMKWSRAVGLLLCHCGVARSIALKLHSWKASARQFRSPAPTADFDFGKLPL